MQARNLPLYRSLENIISGIFSGKQNRRHFKINIRNQVNGKIMNRISDEFKIAVDCLPEMMVGI